MSSAQVTIKMANLRFPAYWVVFRIKKSSNCPQGVSLGGLQASVTVDSGLGCGEPMSTQRFKGNGHWRSDTNNELAHARFHVNSVQPTLQLQSLVFRGSCIIMRVTLTQMRHANL